MSTSQTQNRIERLNLLKEDLLAPGSIQAKLKRITDSLVDIFDADFARIWVSKPADRCNSGCFHAGVLEGPHVCVQRDRCLHLISSSGRYTHIDGEIHRRVPFGCYKIGQIAAAEEPKFVTNNVTEDPRVHNREWAAKLGLTSFAGYRLLSSTKEPIGVLALFSKHKCSSDDDALLQTVASTTSQVIQTAMAEEALRESEQRYRTLTDDVLDTSAVGLFILDASFQSGLGEPGNGTLLWHPKGTGYWKGQATTHSCLHQTLDGRSR